MARSQGSEQQGQSETSPLLSGSSDNALAVSDPSVGIVPAGNATIQNGTFPSTSDSARDAEAGIDTTQSADAGIATSPSTEVDLTRNTTHTSTTSGRQKKYNGIPLMRRRMVYLFPALSIGVFLAAADQTIIVSSYGRIGSDLDALQKTGWIASAYFLTLTSFQPLYGKLSDIFTRKSCLLFAYLVFGIGCLGCGLARTIDELIVARAVAGIGGGGMTTVVSILLSDVIPLQERGTWQGYINIIFASGAGFGAPMGGLFSDGWGWRWSFLFQAPLCLIAFLAVALVMDESVSEEDEDEEEAQERAKEKGAWKAKLKRIDFMGAAALVSAVLALLIGLDRGSNLAWSTKECLIPLSLSFPLFALFLYLEIRVAKEPFAPGRIIFERTLFACYLCNFFSFAGFMATLFYIPLYFQAVKGHTATQAGLLLIPSTACSVSGSLFAGLLMQKTGKYFWLTVAAYSGAFAGMILLLLMAGIVASTDVGVIVGLSVLSFCNGIGVTSSLIALISNAARADQAVATACSYLFRSLGSTAGVSLAASVANQTLRSQLLRRLGSGADADAVIEGVRRSLAYIRTLEPAVQEIVRACYAESTRAAFGLGVGIVAGAAVSAWFIREKPLSR